MIPMLAWIANSASSIKSHLLRRDGILHQPGAVLSTLGTKYLNQIFLVTREVRNEATGALTVPADYSELGILLITVTVLSLLLPLATIFIVQKSPLRSA